MLSNQINTVIKPKGKPTVSMQDMCHSKPQNYLFSTSVLTSSKSYMNDIFRILIFGLQTFEPRQNIYSDH